MYSLLLMTAMAGGPDAPTFGNTLLGHGCGGCAGVVYASCSGSCAGSACYGGSYYSACTGCSGYACGGYNSCSGGLFSGLHARLSTVFSGCCGYSSCAGCTGYASCAGCGGYTSCGGYTLPVGHTAGYYYGSCTGASCAGGCYGSPYYSAYGGCYGSCLGGYAPAYPVYAAPVLGVPDYATPGVIVGGMAPAAAVALSASRYEAGTGGVLASAPPADAAVAAPARLSVEMPPLATLYVDGQPVAGDGKADTRQFHTPDLPRGKAFYYELRADLMVNGKVETESKKVVVRAGDTATEAFPKLIAAAKTAATPGVVAVSNPPK